MYVSFCENVPSRKLSMKGYLDLSLYHVYRITGRKGKPDQRSIDYNKTNIQSITIPNSINPLPNFTKDWLDYVHHAINTRHLFLWTLITKSSNRLFWLFISSPKHSWPHPLNTRHLIHWTRITKRYNRLVYVHHPLNSHHQALQLIGLTMYLILELSSQNVTTDCSVYITLWTPVTSYPEHLSPTTLHLYPIPSLCTLVTIPLTIGLIIPWTLVTSYPDD